MNVNSWLKLIFQTSRIDGQKCTALDSWRDADGFYVNDFKTQLEEIAVSLTSLELNVTARFNPQTKWAELCDASDELLAVVSVYGECGSPYGATVVLISLPTCTETIFTSALSPLNVTFVEDKSNVSIEPDILLI